jgi:DGQHR domain-containing protein
MRFKAIQFIQNGKVFYITTLPASFLIEKCRVDIWKPEINESEMNTDELLREQGYQRAPISSHYMKVARYVSEKDAVLPTAILLSARTKIAFQRIDDSGIGEISLSPDAELYIVDGQHRIYGLNHAINEFERSDLRNFYLPVIIMSEIDKIEEVRQFFIVNSTQKKVRTDLAERLLRIIASKDLKERERLKQLGRDWKLVAIKIIDNLYNDANSVWYQRIKRPNQPHRPEAVASEASFSASLKPLLMFGRAKSEETLLEWIKCFWNALKDLMPDAFEDPRKYVIQKTPGIYSLHMILPDIIFYCMEKKGGVNRDIIKEILSRDEAHFCDSGFWESGGEGAALYNSLGAFRILADELREGLKLR